MDVMEKADVLVKEGKEYWWCFKHDRTEDWMMATEDKLSECVRRFSGKVKVYGPFERLPVMTKHGKWNHFATFEVWYGEIKQEQIYGIIEGILLTKIPEALYVHFYYWCPEVGGYIIQREAGKLWYITLGGRSDVGVIECNQLEDGDIKAWLDLVYEHKRVVGWMNIYGPYDYLTDDNTRRLFKRCSLMYLG